VARGYSSDDEKERAWHCMCTTPIGVENVLPAITTDLRGVGEARAAVPLEEHDRRLANLAKSARWLRQGSSTRPFVVGTKAKLGPTEVRQATESLAPLFSIRGGVYEGSS